MNRILPLFLVGSFATATAAGEGAFLRLPAEVRGDGATVEVEQLSTRTPVRVEVSAGTLRTLPGEGERSNLLWEVPRVAAPLDVRFTVRAARSGKVLAVEQVRAVPPELPVRREEGPLGLSIPRLLSGGPAGIIDAAPGEEALTLLVSAGVGGPFAPDGERRRVTFTPPAEAYPRPVIAAVTGPDGVLRDWTVLALDGLGEVEAVTEPNALVRFELAGEPFGPVRTDARGRARMKVRAPPGVESATAVVADRLGNVRRTEIPLGAPRIPIVLALCEAARGRLVLLAIDGAGRPARAARFAVEAQGGTVSTPAEVAPGRYEAAIVHGPQRERVVVQAGWPAASAPVSVCSFPPPAPVVAAPRPVVLAPPAATPHAFTATPRAGYVFTGGRLSAPVVLVDVGLRPGSLPALSFGLESGYGTSWGQYLDATGSEPFFSRTWLVPVLARAAWTPFAWPLAPYVAVSAGAVVTGATTRSARTGVQQDTRVLPSLGGAVGVAWRVGPGAVVGEAGYVRGLAGTAGALDGWLFSAGYRLER